MSNVYRVSTYLGCKKDVRKIKKLNINGWKIMERKRNVDDVMCGGSEFDLSK